MSLSRHTKSILFITLGWFFFALGIIGLFLPILPTTPFMIAATACFGRGSPRFHAWLLHHPTFGPPIRDWEENRVIRPRHKWFAGVCMGGSAILVWYTLKIAVVGKIAYAITLSLVFAYIVTRKSRP